MQDSYGSMEWKACKLGELRVFGALEFAHVKKDKLEPQVERCTYNGYVEGVNEYKL